MRVALEHVLAHPPERVFAVLCDPTRRPLWQENTSDVELLTPGPARVGTRWTEVQRGVGPVEAEVVALEPGALWGESGSAHGGGGRVTVALSPRGGGEATHLAIDVELHLRGARRLMEGALAPMVRRQMPRDLERLDALLRGEGAPPG